MCLDAHAEYMMWCWWYLQILLLPVSFKKDDKSRSAIITLAFGCIPVTLLGQPKNRCKVNVQKFTYHFHTSDYRKTKDHLFITQHPIYCIFSFECAHINNKSSLWSRIACAYFHCLKIQKWHNCKPSTVSTNFKIIAMDTVVILVSWKVIITWDSNVIIACLIQCTKP